MPIDRDHASDVIRTWKEFRAFANEHFDKIEADLRILRWMAFVSYLLTLVLLVIMPG